MSTRKHKKRKLALSEFTRCHPRIKGKQGTKRTKGTSETCLPDSVSSRLLKTWKVRTLADLWAATSCAPGADHCLLEKSGLGDKEKKDIRTHYLRPRYPVAWRKKPDTWLDNVNIADVMEQYQETFPWFRFMGVLPIDFSIPDPYRTDGVVQCLHKDICDLQLKDEYKRGIRGIGLIFNLDPHDKGGSHWVGLYMDLHNIMAPQISYFDSYGYKTPPMIARLMRAFTLQIPGCRLAYNARRYQRGGTECGMFSMYFLICMIHGIPFDQFCKDAVDDQMMLQLRPILFSS
jgi:hypothetical protein